jgi:hypothetical protein
LKCQVSGLSGVDQAAENLSACRIGKGGARQRPYSTLPRGALTRAFAGSREPDGSYRQDNVFRDLVART